MTERVPPAQALLIAGASTAFVAALRWALDPWLAGEIPLLLFSLSIVVSAWLGGLAGGLAATALAAVVGPLLFLPASPATPAAPSPAARDALRVVVLVVFGLVFGLLTRQRSRALAAAAARARAVEASEAALRESEEKLHLALHAARLVTWDWNLATGHVDRAPTAEPLLGFGSGPAEEFLGRVHPADAARVADAVARARAQHTGYDLEFRLLSPERGTIWVRDVARVRRDRRTGELHLVGVCLDVTESRRSQEALRESEARLRLAMEAADMIGFEWDVATGRIERLDEPSGEPAARRAVRFEEALARVHPDDRPMASARVAAALRGDGEAFASEHRIGPEADGRWRWVLVRGRVARDVEGRPLRMVGLVLDVTARREVEAALRAAKVEVEGREERFRLAADAVDGLIYDYDPRSGRVERSRGVEELLGWPPDAVPPTIAWWHEQMHPDDRAAAETAVGRMLAHGDRYVVEYRVRHRDGHWVHAVDRGIVSRDAAGGVVRQVGCTQDITEMRRVEASLREADRRKDEFLATLAHELRNPLAPLRTGLALLRAAGADEVAAEKARAMMDRQLAQLVRLVDDLLDVSRISNGRLVLRREPLELAEAVGYALEASRPLLAQSGHELVLHLPDGPVWIDADLARLAQVLSNLLHNAAKYTPPGGRIELFAAREGAAAVLRVRDTGDGIPVEMLPRIFEMFAQVDRSPERAQGGLGIGLHLVKRLVELHGGTVEAYSAGPGNGSEFVVRMPLAEAPAAREAPAESTALAAPAPARRRVLIVDDNEDSALSLAMLVNLWGHETRVAHDGLEAVAAAEAAQPDVVLLDLGLPGIDGYEACRRIRAARPPGVPLLCVAVSGWGQEEDKRRSREAGFDVHLVKPVDPGQLQDLLAAQPVAA